jgi:hypothetical protein
VTADTGGGSGKPITPYGLDRQPTEQEVKQAWDEAGRAMRVEGVRVQGSDASRSGYKIGFAYAKADAAAPAPAFELSGNNEQGNPEKVSLANVERITLVSIKKRLTGPNEAIIEIKQFPALSPAELLAAQPTYSTLKSKHTRTLRLRVLASSAEGDFSMIGTEWWSEDKYRVLFRISDLLPAIAIPIRSDRDKGLWWAIPSVVADPAYPHRAVMKH